MFKIDPKKKFFLFKQNPVFCTAPWSLLYINAEGTVTTCVNGREILGNLYDDDIDEIVSSHKLKQVRHDILVGQLTDNCRACVQLENDGDGTNQYQFLRNNYNELCQDLDIDYHDPNEFVLGALDLHWSSLCNLKCVTCWAKQSSSIAKEQNQPILHLSSDQARKFIDWIVERQHTLKELYLSGGEPMLIKYNQWLLSRIDRRSDLRIRVNSNLMWRQTNSVLQQVLDFPNVLMTCSADNLAAKFNYIRRDADWNLFLDNLTYLQQQTSVRLRINMVFFVLSAMDLADTIDFFYERYGISDITINQCGMGQTHLRARNLPVPIKQKCADRLQAAIERYSNNLNLVGQLKNCLNELQNVSNESYHNYFDHIDSLTKRDWRHLFEDVA